MALNKLQVLGGIVMGAAMVHEDHARTNVWNPQLGRVIHVRPTTQEDLVLHGLYGGVGYVIGHGMSKMVLMTVLKFTKYMKIK